MPDFRCRNCLFTETDYILVRKALKTVTRRQAHILFLRFWGRMTIDEIASFLRMKWGAVDRLIDSAIEDIKSHCLGDARFSRHVNNLNGERIKEILRRT